MRMTMKATPVAAALALVLGVLLGGCGGGSGEAVGEFEQLVIGPDGGHAEAQNVALVVPPGAFAQDHVCAILEQPDPLPIEPQADGSTIVYHDNIMCIGPLDLVLLVPGYVRMCYPLTFPPGAGEDDLVLLEWDAGLGAMRVSIDAVQNLATHCFEDFSYDVLGHVAVGRRIAPPDPVDFDFTFYAEPPVAAAGLPAVVQDTGFTAWLPCGEGLHCFTTGDEAARAIEAVEGDWSRHADAARAIAEAEFAAPVVLADLLDRIGLS